MLQARICRNNLVVNIFLHDKLQDTKDWRKHFIDFYEIFDGFFFPNHPRLVFVFYNAATTGEDWPKLGRNYFPAKRTGPASLRTSRFVVLAFVHLTASRMNMRTTPHTYYNNRCTYTVPFKVAEPSKYLHDHC